jgi:hypothetical protein
MSLLEHCWNIVSTMVTEVIVVSLLRDHCCLTRFHNNGKLCHCWNTVATMVTEVIVVSLLPL